ncbi:MAG: (E)-4-hydroxy-3-methylbut-2-enyl-diphosphate synthase, partial [Bacteroidota bacterium]
MQIYTPSLTEYKRLQTREVRIGDLLLGNFNPIRVQTMTTTDTMDTMATVEQSIRCIEAGAELVRITAPSKKEAENLLNIKNELRKRGYHTPLVADIHFTPNAAEIAARIVEKVRVNPGNYVDKKKFEQIEYTDVEYLEEIDRIREKFTPLVRICKEHGTAMRIGTNHGSLSDRIMSRYGDTAIGMVESAMEFLRIARDENFHQIVLSMKSSNPQVMVQAYRLLVKQMMDEFSEAYPLHLGVTEAGDGEDGRIKSAAGIGTLLEDGIGDTIRVSLTEDPEFEIPVCRDLVKRYTQPVPSKQGKIPAIDQLPYSPFEYTRRKTFAIQNIGDKQVPVVVADLSHIENIRHEDLRSVGYHYDESTDKWAIGDMAADYIFTGHQLLNFELPGTLRVIVYPEAWKSSKPAASGEQKYFPLFMNSGFANSEIKDPSLNFVMVDCFSDETPINDYSFLDAVANDPSVVVCVS